MTGKGTDKSNGGEESGWETVEAAALNHLLVVGGRCCTSKLCITRRANQDDSHCVVTLWRRS